MKLDKKKKLASRTFGVGKGRIAFQQNRLAEIAEAITRQDFEDLIKSKAIIIKSVKGRRKAMPGIPRGPGRIKKKIRNRKRVYITLTRKLRSYVKELFKQKKITSEQHIKLRQQIRAGFFKSKSHMQSFLQPKT